MKKKSALLVSVAMVLVAILALTTASFAWFTSNLNPSVGDFTVNVTAGESVLFAVNDGNAEPADAAAISALTYKSVISTDDLKSGFGNDILQDTTESTKTIKHFLKDATPKSITTNAIDLTSGKIAFSTLTQTARLNGPEVYKTGDAEVDGGEGSPVADDWKLSNYADIANNKLTGEVDSTITATEIGRNKYYVSFDLFVKASTPNTGDYKFFLDLTSKGMSTTQPTDEEYKGSDFYAVDKTGTRLAEPETGFDHKYFVTSALRTAFIYSKVVEQSGAAPSTAATPALKVLELSDKHVPTNFQTTVIDSKKTYATTVIKQDKYTTTGTAGESLKIVTTNSDLELFTIKNGEIFKLTVMMWIEGNDADCYNGISVSHFKSLFNFKAVAPNP